MSLHLDDSIEDEHASDGRGGTKVKKLRVVLVDDETDVRGRVKALLEDVPGVNVVGEIGGKENAVEVLEFLSPQVVILDIHLSGGSGLAVLRQIKLFDPSIVVIMLTDFVSSFYRSVCLKGGADFFLDKALELKELKGVVSEISHSGFARNGTRGCASRVGPTIH